MLQIVVPLLLFFSSLGHLYHLDNIVSTEKYLGEQKKSCQTEKQKNLKIQTKTIKIPTNKNVKVNFFFFTVFYGHKCYIEMYPLPSDNSFESGAEGSSLPTADCCFSRLGTVIWTFFYIQILYYAYYTIVKCG